MLNDIFLDNLPKIDLHGYDRDYARIEINDFIRDNYIQKNYQVLIIHGVGTGILRKTTHETLKHNKLVSSYKLRYLIELNLSSPLICNTVPSDK